MRITTGVGGQTENTIEAKRRTLKGKHTT